ncbi:uncharacterized protein EV420DRAFT_1649415 [Desarmillaria tabescens]|uniref:UvrD-like helicase ATP-binding domain-containing protein n=1 Tax=Armillaria tabescens TaxID=1929756 RepID=A0AA39JI07_ARMTA|nr:uncharacterized protein EV420DRAFT_1649415 [Desarmillaria tabescens]KAK0443136.1 hypothetical protein EV420DRAFT_1649415 [Desarmillaria tabescens]
MPRKRIYRSDLFSQEQLASVDALESALWELQNLLTIDNFKHVFQELFDNESPHILLLVLSSLSETTSLTSWLLESFPSEPADYDASVHYKAISCLSAEFLSSPFVEDKKLCARYHEITQLTPKVLKYLVSLLRPIDIGSEHHNKKGKTKRSQRKLQQVKQDDGATASVKKYFDVLNVDMPETSSEAFALMDHILQSQKDILRFYLELLRRSEISVSLKERCITSTSTIEGKDVSGSVVELPSTYPVVQQMKSALHFDTAEGFGEWRVTISADADNFLRSAHKKDFSIFNITLKKIKELSCGLFSDNNQRRLSGNATEVPVFEAKISHNLRLIYQIDIIPGDGVEQQAIKIFGIYTHAQIDNRLWSSISTQLRKKGKEYQKRCVVRKRADYASKNIFTPAFFAPLPEVLPSEDILDLRPDETAQVHSRLVVEKYITFSQPFLNTVLADVDATFPHTVSTQEKRIIEHPQSCYVIGRSGTGKTTTMLFKMLLIERTFQLMESNLPRPRQVFVTKSRMLAKKVQEYFAKLVSSLAIASEPSADVTNLPRAPQYQSDLGLIDVDDIVDWRTDLPAKYSELEDRHFPLFITFDGLCELLEADMGVTRPIDTKRIITFESFCEFYWPHCYNSRLDPASVFSEFIGNTSISCVKGLDLSLRSGVIEGSAETLSEEKRYLSRATYLDLSKRQYSTFSDQRCEVYRLFELYMRKKKFRGEYDTGDRTHSILKHFMEKGVPGQGLDHLYVDEVQDNMLIDTMVLRLLCHNADGLFWAGDTAQTISVGSSFRFSALKAFQWNIEDKYRRKHRIGAQHPPEMFQLAVNYRSHAGIVDCARSIIDLLMTFWNDSIDRLSPEMGIVGGAKPVFFNNKDRAQLEQFIFGDGGDPIEFGAQQCIIVRNEMARERLRQKVGEVGLVLTVYECKGLEFNDVLLYNFFADSSADLAQWRFVLNAIKESKQDPKNRSPVFNRIRHASICHELKSLYVAITRARENIWIADGSEIGELMRLFWTSKDLINNYTPRSGAPRLASSSTPEAWATEGRELFNAKQFSQAKYCYIKANFPFLASVAHAYDLRAKARKVTGISRQKVFERRSCFAEAAISFLECAKKASAGLKDSMTYLRISGECFEQADQKYQAAQVFLRAQEYTHAAELYRDIGKFDEAVEIVKAHEDEMSSKVVENVIKLARLAYLSNHQMTKARELFQSVEEEVEYLEERDLDVALADLLEKEGRLSKAAELHYSEGRKEQAIELFLCQTKSTDALRRAQECILEELWHSISFGADPNVVRSDPTVLRLMRFASRLDATSTKWTKAAERSMFVAITQDQATRLRELGLEFHKMGHSSAALLCLDQYFSRSLRIQNMTLVDAVQELSLFYTYVGLLSAAAFRMDPCRDVATAALFGFRWMAENEFVVLQNTWMHSAVLKLRPRNMLRDSDFNLRLSVLELRVLFREVLRRHLKERIATENDECAKSKAFRPCLIFGVSGFCKRPECPEAHVSPSVINPGYYNMRIRLHLQQILILQSLRENAHADVEYRGTKFWLNRLCDALHPPHPKFGSISHLALSTIPEAQKALNVVKDWVRTVVYDRKCHPKTNFLADVMRTATLAFTFDRSQASYLRNAAYFREKYPPSTYIRRGNVFIPRDLLNSMSGSQIWSLTAGFLFVEHVVKQRLPIKIGDLCDFVDFLCSSVILCGRRSGMLLSPNVTVPRSWLLRFVRYDLPYFNEGIQTNYYRTLLEPMRDLLEQLRASQSCEHLLYGTKRNLSNVSYRVRHVFIARIFKAVCLLGYNIRDEFLRSDIKKKILSFSQERSPLYDRYIDAASDSWDKLAKVIRRSLQSDTMDEMILLIHQSRVPGQRHALLGVRQLVYSDFADIQAQLGLTQAVPATSPTTSSHLEVPGQVADGDGEVEDMEDAQEAEAVEETAGDDAVAVNAIPVQDMTAPEPTEREIAAAFLIQRVYRRVLRHRRGIAKRGRAGLHAQIYASCTKEVSRLGDNPGLYLRLFLGPLPHILVCLEIIRIDTLSQKKKMKNGLKGHEASPDEIATLDDLLTQTNKANKDVIKLQTDLSPSSAFHERCDGKGLRKLVEEAHVLVSSLPFKTSSDLSDDLHLAIKGIVTERSSAGTRKKPTLNI